jgi:hypothetical protein
VHFSRLFQLFGAGRRNIVRTASAKTSPAQPLTSHDFNYKAALRNPRGSPRRGNRAAHRDIPADSVAVRPEVVGYHVCRLIVFIFALL